jgi:uncharacterized membrane protein
MKAVIRWLIGVLFVVAGANHFRLPAIYLAMIPPVLPHKELLNQIAGSAEILGGLGLLIPGVRRWAAWGLILLLVAVFPANVYVALRGHMDYLNVSPLVLWLRLPFQAVFIAAVAWAGGLGRWSATSGRA